MVKLCPYLECKTGRMRAFVDIKEVERISSNNKNK
jgi:hypothetical protein